MSRYLDIYQHWGTGMSIHDLSEKYHVNEATITNTIKMCEGLYLEPIFGDFMLEDDSHKHCRDDPEVRSEVYLLTYLCHINIVLQTNMDNYK